MRKYIFPLFMFLFAAATWVSVPSIIKVGDRYRANQQAMEAVKKYALKDHYKVPEAKVEVRLVGDLETVSKRFRRQTFDIVYLLGKSMSKGSVSITFAKVKGTERAIELYDMTTGKRIKL